MRRILGLVPIVLVSTLTMVGGQARALAPAPTLTLSASQVTYGDPPVRFTATGCAGAVGVGFVAPWQGPGVYYHSVPVDASGGGSVTFNTDGMGDGSFKATAFCVDANEEPSSAEASVTLVIDPGATAPASNGPLQIQPSVGKPGDTVNVSGHFEAVFPASPISAFLYPGAISLEATATLAQPPGGGYPTGDFTASVILPGVAAGNYTIVYTSGASEFLTGAITIAAPASLVSVPPVRVFDTRPGEADGLRPVSKVKVSPTNVLRVKLTGLTGRVPETGVAAVSLNVTATETQAPGFVTVWPCDAERPLASSINYAPGATVPNQVITPVSASGEVCFYSLTPVHLLADVSGYFGTGAQFKAIAPVRVFDTRSGELDGLRVVPKAKVSPANPLVVKLTDLTGRTPADGVAAVSLNLTATDSDGPGFVTVYPCGSDLPLVSSLNYGAGATVANAVIAPVAADGTVCFYTRTPTQLLADINGYFSTGVGFTAVAPTRLFDTRATEAAGAITISKHRLAAGGTLEVNVTGLAGLTPATGVRAVSLNVTAVFPSGPGFLTVYPCGDRPLASNVNYAGGDIRPNAVIAPIATNGTVCFFSPTETDVIADINGYFAG